MDDFLIRQSERKAKIAVFGDCMRDEYYTAKINRISPEFPIPIIMVDEPPKILPGGAGNVYRQFQNFNFEIDLFAILENLPVKKRYYDGKFPLCRIDDEKSQYGLTDLQLKEIQNKLLNQLHEKTYEVIIFSDYNKGIFKDIELKNIPKETITIVDPKEDPIERWKNCTIIKPNSKEAEKLSGSEDWKKQCEYFLRKTNCQSVIITQEGNGVAGYATGKYFEYRPDFKIKASSVIGAGDLFVAFLAMYMSHSIDIEKAVECAFKICSKYVLKDYGAVVYPYELIDNKEGDFFNPRDFKLAMANGCFDICHLGHIELLKFAKSKADKLVVALNSDESVKKQNKSHCLINDLEYRIKMIKSLEFVDFVTVFEEETPLELIKKIKPEVLVKGGDWQNIVGSELVDEVYSFNIIEDYSTTNIIEKINFCSK